MGVVLSDCQFLMKEKHLNQELRVLTPEESSATLKVGISTGTTEIPELMPTSALKLMGR